MGPGIPMILVTWAASDKNLENQNQKHGLSCHGADRFRD